MQLLLLNILDVKKEEGMTGFHLPEKMVTAERRAGSREDQRGKRREKTSESSEWDE